MELPMKPRLSPNTTDDGGLVGLIREADDSDLELVALELDECPSALKTIDPICSSESTSPDSTSPDSTSSACGLIIALFCDGFVCRHFTRKSGWVEGFAQSYDATSRYFLECLERGWLPDGLSELVDVGQHTRELIAEVWDFQPCPHALCPLTSADLPRSPPSEVSGTTVLIRQLVLRSPREQVVVTQDEKDLADTDFDDFPQLSNADLDALTNDELANLALGAEADDLLELDSSLAALNSATEPTTETPIPLVPVSNHLKRKARVHVDVQNVGDAPMDMITPKRTVTSGTDLDSWSSSLLSMAFLSPSECKTMKPIATENGGHRKVKEESKSDTSMSSTEDDLTISIPDDESLDWVVKSPVLSTLSPKTEFFRSNTSPPSQSISEPTDEIDGTISDPVSDQIFGLELNEAARLYPPSPPVPQVKLSLSPKDFNLEAPKARSRMKKKPLPPPNSPAASTPFPATHQFLAKLKGKRRRNYTIDELHEGSPAWMMMKHMNRFYQAAFVFERRHSQFLQVNIERIMKADTTTVEPTKLTAGSMNYLAMQLQDLKRPTDVIARAASIQHEHARSRASERPRRPSPLAACTSPRLEHPRSPRTPLFTPLHAASLLSPREYCSAKTTPSGRRSSQRAKRTPGSHAMTSPRGPPPNANRVNQASFAEVPFPTTEDTGSIPDGITFQF